MPYLGDVQIGVSTEARTRKLLAESLAEWKDFSFFLYELAAKTKATHFRISERKLETVIEFDGTGIPQILADDPFAMYPEDHAYAKLVDPLLKVIAGILGTGSFPKLTISSHEGEISFEKQYSVEKDVLKIVSHKADGLETQVRFGRRDFSALFGRNKERPLKNYLAKELYSSFPVSVNGTDVHIPIAMPDALYAYAFSPQSGPSGIIGLRREYNSKRDSGIIAVSYGRKFTATTFRRGFTQSLEGIVSFTDLPRDMSGVVTSEGHSTALQAIQALADEFFVQLAKDYGTLPDADRRKLRKPIIEVMWHYLSPGVEGTKISAQAFQSLSELPVIMDHSAKPVYSVSSLAQSFKLLDLKEISRSMVFERKYVLESFDMKSPFDFPVVLCDTDIEKALLLLIEEPERSKTLNITDDFRIRHKAYLHDSQPPMEPKLPSGSYILTRAINAQAAIGEVGIPISQSSQDQKDNICLVLSRYKRVCNVWSRGASPLPFTGIVNNDNLVMSPSKDALLDGKNSDYFAAIRDSVQELYADAANQYQSLGSNERKLLVEYARRAIRYNQLSAKELPDELVLALGKLPMVATVDKRNVTIDEIAADVQASKGNPCIYYLQSEQLVFPQFGRLVLNDDERIHAFCCDSLSKRGITAEMRSYYQLRELEKAKAVRLDGVSARCDVSASNVEAGGVKYRIQLGISNQSFTENQVTFAIGGRLVEQMNLPLAAKGLVVLVDSMDLPLSVGNYRVSLQTATPQGKALLERIGLESEKYVRDIYSRFKAGRIASRQFIWGFLAENAHQAGALYGGGK